MFRPSARSTATSLSSPQGTDSAQDTGEEVTSQEYAQDADDLYHEVTQRLSYHVLDRLTEPSPYQRMIIIGLYLTIIIGLSIGLLVLLALLL